MKPLTDTTDRIERVAMAIAEKQRAMDQAEAKLNGMDIVLLVDAYIPWAREMARTAIEALRIESPVTDVYDNTVVNSGLYGIYIRECGLTQAQEDWNRAIDDALGVRQSR